MYKVQLLVRFRKDIPVEEARREWQGSHGSLALTLPGLRRYVQHLWVGGVPAHEQAFDGVVELGFDDEASFLAAFGSSVGQAMNEDDLRIFDRSATPAYIGGVVEEHVMLDH